MAAAPIYDDVLPIRTSLLHQIPVRAGIDRGCTLTKVLFKPRSARLDSEFTPMRCLTFLNDHFETALHIMKEEADLPQEGELHVTGVGCANYKDQIQAVLGLSTLFVPEMTSITRGVFLMVSNTEPEHIFCPQPPFKAWSYDSKLFEEAFVQKNEEKKEESADKPFPAGLVYIGSGAGISIIDAHGKTKTYGMPPMAGKSFMGLAKLLLGTSDYDDIMALAAKGDRRNVDYQIRDFLNSDDTDYGQFPKDMPVFSFGKAGDRTWGDTQASKEDLAASLVAFLTCTVVYGMSNVSRITGIKKFYVSGNFTRSELARSFMLESSTIIKTDMDIRFLTSGHQGAMAAMVSGPEDTMEKWIVDDIDI